MNRKEKILDRRRPAAGEIKRNIKRLLFYSFLILGGDQLLGRRRVSSSRSRTRTLASPGWSADHQDDHDDDNDDQDDHDDDDDDQLFIKTIVMIKAMISR